MTKFDSDWFEKESKKLKYDVSAKEVFGNDVLLTYKYNHLFRTPREDCVTKKFSMIPLWYLDFLASVAPTQIVDVGCGANLFKHLIKKIYNIDCHGIDPTPENYTNRAADEFDHFDSEFSQGHTEAYQCAFSINALHFVPLSQLTTRVMDFYNIVAKGGRGFLALNSARMLERSNSEWLLSTFETSTPSSLQVQEYVYNQLSTLDIDFIVIDLLITEQPNEVMDGNIRMVFKK
jgi:hypothetical protein